MALRSVSDQNRVEAFGVRGHVSIVRKAASQEKPRSPQTPLDVVLDAEPREAVAGR